MAGDRLDCGRLLRQPLAIYPKVARSRRVEGVVRLNVFITRTGEVRDITVVEGDPLLVPAALAAVRQWRYAPCLLNSEPVELRSTIDVNFTLHQ